MRSRFVNDYFNWGSLFPGIIDHHGWRYVTVNTEGMVVTGDGRKREGTGGRELKKRSNSLIFAQAVAKDKREEASTKESRYSYPAGEFVTL